MVRSIISSFVVTGIVLFAAADVEAGKPRRHGSICDEAGLIGSAYGACNAYCEALDCDSPEPGGSERACEQARNYESSHVVVLLLQPVLAYHRDKTIHLRGGLQ